MKVAVDGTQDTGFIDSVIPDFAVELSWGALESRGVVEAEIDLMLGRTRDLWSMEPDQAMIMISAMTARCTELCVHLHRLEGRREWRQVRTLQVDRLLTELDRQWKTASRMVELRRQDLAVAK